MELSPENLRSNLTEAVKNVLAAQAKAGNLACIDVAGEMKARVFNRGEDAIGAQIGQYSTKPIYVSIAGQSSQVKRSGLKPRGKKKGENKAARSSKNVTTTKRFKTDLDDFTSKTSRLRKTMYFAGGYAEYRNAVGRQSQKIDLFLTGALSGAIVTDGSRVAFIEPAQTQKARGLESRFKKTIFAASATETERAVAIVEDILTEAFFKSFK